VDTGGAVLAPGRCGLQAVTRHRRYVKDRLQRRTLHRELDGVLGGREPTVEDLPALPFTEQVVKESLRLYPPAWSLGREPLEDDEVGGWRIPAGAAVVMNPWTVHRDGRFYEEPEAFRPRRWADGLEQRLPRFAWFPFGGGPRHGMKPRLRAR
jgi:cytochrome P450